MEVSRLLIFIMKIMYIFLSLLGTLLIATGLGLFLLKARVLKSKYEFRMVYRSSSL